MTRGRYTAELAGRRIEVAVSDHWLTCTAVLSIDGKKAVEGTETLEAIDLRYEDIRVHVKTRLSGGLDTRPTRLAVGTTAGHLDVGWWDTVMGSTKYWLPILIAIGIASNEVEKRRKANEAKRQRDES